MIRFAPAHPSGALACLTCGCGRPLFGTGTLVVVEDTEEGPLWAGVATCANEAHGARALQLHAEAIRSGEDLFPYYT